MDARFLHMPEGGMFSTWDIRPLTTSDRLEGALYGDRLFTRIRSGIILTGPSDMFDLLGTGELDCCTAIAGLRKNGSLLLGHIPGPHAAHLLETISKLKSFDLDRAYLIHPQLPTNGYRDPTHAERAKDGNETYKNIAEKFGMRRIGYASSSFPGEREPDQYSSLRTLVTINRDGVCISLNRERVSSYLVPNDGRHLRMHYEPLATGTFAWDEA